MPNIGNVPRDFGKWKYLIIAEMILPNTLGPIIYGVATAFKGIRIYACLAMGMPGSETCLEELMSMELGNLIEEGCVAKIADDLYVGDHFPENVLLNWRRVLTVF